MKIKEIIGRDLAFLNYPIEVNGEKYNYHKHGNLIHVDTAVETQEDYNYILNSIFYRTKIKFTAVEREKIEPLIGNKENV